MLERAKKGVIPPPFSISTIRNQTLSINELVKTQDCLPSPPQNHSHKCNSNETITNIEGKSYTDLMNVLPENLNFKTATNTEQIEKTDSDATECDEYLEMDYTTVQNTDQSNIQIVQEHPHKDISEEENMETAGKFI